MTQQTWCFTECPSGAGCTLQEESLIKIPSGKVGFRNWDGEEAPVHDVRIMLDP